MTWRFGKGKRTRPKPRKAFNDRRIVYMTKSLICLALIGVFGLGTYVYAKAEPCFRVQTIRVEGADKLQEDAIIAQSGVSNEDCLLFLDAGAVRDRVAAIPYVRSCRVMRYFPNKLVIGIQERVALATLMVENRLFEIDDEGNVLRELPRDKGHVGPFITNVADLGYVEAGQQLNQRALMKALAVWCAFSRTAMARDVTVSEISAAQENRIRMYCDELNFEIRWGRDNIDKQAKKLDIFWSSQNKNVHCKDYVDLRFGNDVACR